MKYTITITRTYSTRIDVEANNLTEAQQLLDSMYDNGEVAMLELEQNCITDESYVIQPSKN